MDRTVAPVLRYQDRVHLLERLRVILLSPDDVSPLDHKDAPQTELDATLMALTADARLQQLGYRLDEGSLLQLRDLYLAGTFCDPLAVTNTLVPKPDAEPLYPDFPTQVLSMDEATYRTHQAVHYFSTYGVEAIAKSLGLNIRVQEGLRPATDMTKKSRRDSTLRKARPITLAFSPEEAASLVWERIVYRNERMTLDDLFLVKGLPIPTDADGSKIAFHENALVLLSMLTDRAQDFDVATFVTRARTLAQHPGDVIKFVAWLHDERRTKDGSGYHISIWMARRGLTTKTLLSTSQRKRLVALLESFPAWSLAENLTLNRERSLRVLEELSYNRFSRSTEHREVVRQLRNGELKSWASKKEAAYRSGDATKILAVLSERPGIMLRELVRLMRLGVPEEDVADALMSHGQLSNATLLNTIARLESDVHQGHRARIEEMQRRIAKAQDTVHRERELKEHNAWVELFDWECWLLGLPRRLSYLHPLTGTLAANAKKHKPQAVPGRQAIHALRFAAERAINASPEKLAKTTEYSILRYAIPDLHLPVNSTPDKPAWLSDQLDDVIRSRALEATRAESPDSRYAIFSKEMRLLIHLLEATNGAKDQIREELRVYMPDLYHDPQPRRPGHLDKPIDEDAIQAAIRVMRRALAKQLAEAETPLRGKKVYVDEGECDLARSEVRTNMGSVASSYFAPGLAVRIPEEAHVVRFFVFWNDSSHRVDLDLHTYANTGVSVGWNSDYKQAGMVTSGDVTTSHNSAEYIDINIEEALAAGVSTVDAVVDYYNGKQLANVQTAFTGLLAVDHTEPDYQLYTSENVMMRSDLTQVQAQSVHVCTIDLERRCVRAVMSRNTSRPNASHPTTFSAQEFVDMLIEAQGATRVETQAESDVTLVVTRPETDEISLIDNGWFVL